MAEAADRRRAGVAEVTARLHSNMLGKAAELVETAVPETLAYYAFPEEHWRRIRTTDEIDKRLCVRRGSFCASDLVAKRGATAGSAARCLLLSCRVKALAHSFAGATR
jgi:mutator family transposase